MSSRAPAWRAAAPLACAAAILSCAPQGGERAQGTFGVLWGGQVQSRATLPLELDRSRQRIGFRVDFPRPLTTETLLEWELEMPATRRRPAPTGRITRLGQVKVPPGRLRVEQETPLEADDPPGTWRVRILAGGEVVLERSFEVVAGGSRPAASAR